MADRCIVCGAKSIAYCDAPIAYRAIGFRRVVGQENTFTGVVGSNPDGTVDSWTCDAALCGDHAHKVGHVCGKHPDTIDYCPLHCEQGTPDSVGSLIVLDEAEACTRRREAHALLRRSAMSAAPTQEKA